MDSSSASVEDVAFQTPTVYAVCLWSPSGAGHDADREHRAWQLHCLDPLRKLVVADIVVAGSGHRRRRSVADIVVAS